MEIIKIKIKEFFKRQAIARLFLGLSCECFVKAAYLKKNIAINSLKQGINNHFPDECDFSKINIEDLSTKIRDINNLNENLKHLMEINQQ